MKFANASLTISRKGTTVATGVRARVRPGALPKPDANRPSTGTPYKVRFDPGVDVRIADRLTGYNLRGQDTAPELVVESVRLYDGPLGFLKVTAVDPREAE